MAIAMLTEAFRVRDVTPVMVKVYDQALQKVPVPLLEPMARRAIETRQFFPRPAELLLDAEAVRKELIAAHAYDGCAQCEMSVGWLASGDKAVTRCPCFARHQAKLAGLGVGPQLALPAAEPEVSRVGE